MSQPLADPEDLATYMREDVDTAWATLVLAGASEVIRDYCGWPITAYTDTATLDTRPERLVMLQCLHVTAVNSVTLDGVLLDPAEYTWSEMGALHRTGTIDSGSTLHPPIIRHRDWPPGFRRLVVDYEGGYTDVPPELVSAVCSMAWRSMFQPGASYFRERVGNIDILTQWNQGMQNAKLLPSEQAACDKYRIPGES